MSSQLWPVHLEYLVNRMRLFSVVLFGQDGKCRKPVRRRSVTRAHFTVKGEEFLETNFINWADRAATPVGRATDLRPSQGQRPEPSTRRPRVRIEEAGTR